MIRIARGAEPQGLKTVARRRLNAAVKAINLYGVPSEALSKIQTGYGTSATKLALFRAQREKCAWCERYTDFSSAPVEHYRPKDGAWRNLPREKRRVDAGHYWWLTWTWSNLLFSCMLPLPSPLVDLSTEEPLLLDPAGDEDPLDHIAWIPLNTSFNKRDWIWTPEGLTDKGRATIAILKLEELADRAQGHVCKQLLPSIEEIEEHLEAGRPHKARLRWKRLLEDSLAPSAQWSALTWHALRHLVTDRYRAQHGLVAPTRPGAY